MRSIYFFYFLCLSGSIVNAAKCYGQLRNFDRPLAPAERWCGASWARKKPNNFVRKFECQKNEIPFGSGTFMGRTLVGKHIYQAEAECIEIKKKISKAAENLESKKAAGYAVLECRWFPSFSKYWSV